VEPWNQVNVTFHDWHLAEPTVLTHLAPHLAAAETNDQIRAWFFLRKHPCWRIRYLPAAAAQAQLEEHLHRLTAEGHLAGWVTVVYEPEVHAFGGPEAMAAAHRLFHHDSRSLLAYLTGHSGPEASDGGAGHRRETSLLLCSILLRAAQQDWYEQADVWARVAAHRAPATSTTPDRARRLSATVRRLITVDAEALTSAGAELAHLATWAAAYAGAGRDLATLWAAGRLQRGLRDILAHHVLFAWNRMGLTHATQATLAATAKAVGFGTEPATSQGA
jgi:thiopeptide-type bacteriocin biosynthesis protein